MTVRDKLEIGLKEDAPYQTTIARRSGSRSGDRAACHGI